MFADDTNIFYSHKSIDTLNNVLNIELTKVSDWFKTVSYHLTLAKNLHTFQKPQFPKGKL